MSKAEKLQIEESARSAVNALYNSQATREKIPVADGGPVHEFDIYQANILIGGVSTSPYLTTKGKSNTGGRDRAAAELLWLSLWKGGEKRVHVLTCQSMASWLIRRFQGAGFPFPITIYHYCPESGKLSEIGVLSA